MTVAAIIDYGAGNLFSISKALEKTGLKVETTSNPKDLEKSDTIVLPGVGNFGPAARKLDPLKNTIIEEVTSGKLFLGSCLGMQLLFESSEESPGDGLGLVQGEVKKFSEKVKIPHMGWNTILRKRDSPILNDIPDESYFYFVHSYFPRPENSKDILAVTTYGKTFTSIVERGNIIGTQFHPEKSGEIGARLLENFASMVRV
ncbi:imidazole glycerol phosphate synthase subunit HisH [Candidatus Bathyarchaeota archaeon]|nr:imidazole glycerol phosphate synthase subunit HisH [Candidatus Bathyarchaeota archaeon]